MRGKSENLNLWGVNQTARNIWFPIYPLVCLSVCLSYSKFCLFIFIHTIRTKCMTGLFDGLEACPLRILDSSSLDFVFSHFYEVI